MRLFFGIVSVSCLLLAGGCGNRGALDTQRGSTAASSARGTESASSPKSSSQSAGSTRTTERQDPTGKEPSPPGKKFRAEPDTLTLAAGQEGQVQLTEFPERARMVVVIEPPDSHIIAIPEGKIVKIRAEGQPKPATVTIKVGDNQATVKVKIK